MVFRFIMASNMSMQLIICEELNGNKSAVFRPKATEIMFQKQYSIVSVAAGLSYSNLYYMDNAT